MSALVQVDAPGTLVSSTSVKRPAPTGVSDAQGEAHAGPPPKMSTPSSRRPDRGRDSGLASSELAPAKRKASGADGGARRGTKTPAVGAYR